MFQRRVRLMAVWIVVAGGGLVLTQVLSASPQRPSETVAATQTTATSPSTPPAPSVHHQMEALAAHAKTRMILYPGRIHQGDLATLKSQLDTIALKSPLQRRP
jgi:hypothetical protein